MLSVQAKCPIWQVGCTLWRPYTDRDRDRDRGVWRIESSVRASGTYEITPEARYEVGDMDDSEKARLTSILVEQWIKGSDVPRLTADDVRRARESQRLPTHERADRLLRFLAKESMSIGQISMNNIIPYRFSQKSLAWSESIEFEEVEFLADYLKSQGWIKTGRQIRSRTAENLDKGLHLWRVEVPGYSRIEVLETNPDSSQCFVAMWFGDEMDEVYENGIRPAIEATGYSPVRIDRQEFVGKIGDEIIAEIRRSRFLVADFTHGDDGARGGVYYEAGFAHGLGLQVIFTCHKDLIDEVHFDTRQFNHIVWEDYDDLCEQLKNRIGSVLGDGPNAKR